MQNEGVSTYHITIEDDKLGVRPEVLVAMYKSIDARARQLASQDIKSELIISQDGRINSKFYIHVSNKMAPHLIAAIQEQADSESGIGMKSYFYNLQEQVMSQMFADVKNVIG
jgi:hypothetical protein